MKTWAKMQDAKSKKMDTFAKFFPESRLRHLTNRMYNSFLIEIIRALGVKGRQEAILFLASPYFNRGSNAQDVRALFNAVLNAAPDFQKEQLSRDLIYKMVFPGKPVIPGKLDKLMTELKKQLRLFVLTEDYFASEKEDWQELHWASWLRKHEMQEKFKLALDKVKKQERASLMPGNRLLLDIADEEFEWESFRNDWSNELGIPNLIQELDLFYYVYRADLANRFLQQQKAFNTIDISILFRDESFYETQSPVLRLLRKVSLLLQKERPDITDFEQLLTLIEEDRPKIPAQLLQIYFAYLRNICTIMIDAGQLEYIPILHQIQKTNLSDGYFNYEGKVHVNAYLNIVQIALRAKEIAWAMEVTENYKDLLYGVEHGHFFYHINLAYCLFAEGKYEESLSCIPDAQSAPQYFTMARRLELKAYYELNSDLLPYKMDSFRKFIERTAPKTISANVRAMNLNFIYILNQLSQSPPKDRKRAEKILQRIEERPLLGERTWLIEKANNLK